ncbi:MAG: hypothetical protein ACRDYB_11940 [Acidimicrobiales bacterium]
MKTPRSMPLVGLRTRTNIVRQLMTFETDRAFYLALSELNHRYAPVGAEPGERHSTTSLAAFELRVLSQNGEDGVLAEIFRRIGAPARFFVEFGVESGREGTCVYLADIAEWAGLFIEADPSFYRELEHKYAASAGVLTSEAMVTPANVEELFKRANVPTEPDVVSIDIDGGDYWVWEAIVNYRPRVVVIEYNAAIDPRRRLVQPRERTGWDGTDFFGASVAALQALGESKGYRLVHTELAGLNAFFVREDVAEDRFSEAGRVPVRGFPNYFLRGYRHPRSSSADRSYLDIDTGELVPAGESPSR